MIDLQLIIGPPPILCPSEGDQDSGETRDISESGETGDTRKSGVQGSQGRPGIPWTMDSGSQGIFRGDQGYQCANGDWGYQSQGFKGVRGDQGYHGVGESRDSGETRDTRDTRDIMESGSQET